jgi:hypothetical protein
MPTQTTDLFLLEDLEDAGKASELAESDLDALHAVADWIKSYVVKPHKELGRAGPVSPFVPGALDRKTFWLAPEQIADRDVPAVVELQPSWAGRLAHYASARARDPRVESLVPGLHDQ